MSGKLDGQFNLKFGELVPSQGQSKAKLRHVQISQRNVSEVKNWSTSDKLDGPKDLIIVTKKKGLIIKKHEFKHITSEEECNSQIVHPRYIIKHYKTTNILAGTTNFDMNIIYFLP